MSMQTSDASLIAAGSNEANLHLFRPGANKVKDVMNRQMLASQWMLHVQQRSGTGDRPTQRNADAVAILLAITQTPTNAHRS